MNRQEMMELLKAGASGSNPYAEGDQQRKNIAATHSADLDSQQQTIDRAMALRDYLAKSAPGHKYNVNVSKEGAAVSEADAMPNLGHQLAVDRLKQSKMENLSKRYENLSDFNSSIQDIEKLSNADGQGGILNNSAAQLPGTGKTISALPSSAVGLGSYLQGMLPKGMQSQDLAAAPEMRKALDRVQLGYARALGGARGVNPAMMAKEKEAMGYIASGDPELVKKGVLSLAGAVNNHYKTIQSGYTPDVLDAVHQTLGGNPLDMYSHIPSMGPAGKAVGQQQQQAPVSPPPPGNLPPVDFDAEDRRRAAMKVKQPQGMPNGPQ